MKPLDRQLRSQLERAVKSARTIADSAARAVLEHLGVGEPNPFPQLSEADADLRRRLRIHGRQLGDKRNSETKAQELDRLTEEVAYEHWHRMLFARFLAENNLLMYPDPSGPVAITLQECEDLASDEGASSGWELAARFAARMLPQIFRVNSPVYELTLPPEYQQRLEKLIADLPTEVFTASDSLGWVYQFWQADNKERINKSEVKIGARELPAVTQLFTEPYMVSFLLDNALGAWWASRRLSEHDLKTAASEEELRRKAAIPGVPLEYLRFVQDEGGTWQPAAGTFDGWPEQLKDLKALDPCCGSGHFLVAIFLMLVPMRMERDRLSAQDAVEAVLRENIHGLEIDKRCVELAAFALALTAWRYPGSGGHRTLPELNLACSGLSVGVAKDEWKQLGLGKRNLTIALDWMHDIFRDAPVLGSLLNPENSSAAKIISWEELSGSLEAALRLEHATELWEAAVAAQGLAKASILLSKKYHFVATNVPYLGTRKQCSVLRKFSEKYSPRGKADLATVFLDRCMDFCFDGGVSSIVLPQNWLFLGSYESFRRKLLERDAVNFLTSLGSGAFETISGEVVKAVMLTITRGERKLSPTSEWHRQWVIRGIDVSTKNGALAKSQHLITSAIKCVPQSAQFDNPDARIILDERTGALPLLNEKAICLTGAMNGDSPKFLRLFFEFSAWPREWVPLQTAVTSTVHFGGREQLIFFDLENGHLREDARIRRERLHNSDERGNSVWNMQGVLVNRMGTLSATIYGGHVYDQNGAAVVPQGAISQEAMWGFLSSTEFQKEVRRLDAKVGVTPATLAKVPVDIDTWTAVAASEFPLGLPQPYSNDPIQWIFHGHPCGSVLWDNELRWTAEGPLRIDETVLQVGVARLLGYRWPAELDREMELAKEQRVWVERCDSLLPHADVDGIVCLPPVRGEAKAVDRLVNLLAAAYGEAWTPDTLARLLASGDHVGKSLDSWLRDKFFAQHCKLFQHRPFIWHIWDGLKDGFAALVNYHKLDRKALETLIYTYLGDWMKTQRDDIARGVDGAQEKLAAAEALKKKLELILEGEEPYDIFVRWKALEEQPVGWDPDLNDGVRLNIRPFLSVGDVGKRGAGVLRDVPNVNWNKDRGKDVESAPWFDLFQGERLNDHHLSLTEKRAARETRQ
ncbi:Eco57I restriction-modification methylase domain-containing protein [Sinorhizobium meliloti]|uniref:Eco57I restriction-modification methylase domain-containing protein n=1 Tax=Rhizobium meliloti TaxID=382 RepID=UPI00398D1753